MAVFYGNGSNGNLSTIAVKLSHVYFLNPYSIKVAVGISSTRHTGLAVQ